eukprot:6895886-Alexandrium_andersonii.AAC.1
MEPRRTEIEPTEPNTSLKGAQQASSKLLRPSRTFEGLARLSRQLGFSIVGILTFRRARVQ